MVLLFAACIHGAFGQNDYPFAETHTASVGTDSGSPSSNQATTDGGLTDIVVTDSHDFVVLGNRAYNDGLFDMAEKMYTKYWEKATSQDHLIDAAVNLTRSKISQNKIDEAMTVLQGVPVRNRELHPDPNSQYHQLTKDNYFTVNIWVARLLYIEGDLDGAASIYNEVIDQSDSLELKTRASLGLAECLIGLENWAQAKAILNKVIESNSDEKVLNEAYVELIQVAIAEKDFDHANTLIVSGLDTASVELRESLESMQIVLLLAQGKPVDAFNLYRDTFANKTDYFDHDSNYPILRNLGISLTESKEFSSAKNVFKKMLPLLRNEYQKKEILLDLARVEDASGKSQVAINHYLRYVELYENDSLISKIRLRIAQLYEESGDFDEALEYYLKVYNTETQLPAFKYEASQKIAWIYRNHQKDYEKAIKYFFESSTLNIGDGEKAKGIFFAAETYFMVEDFNNAAIYYQSIPDSYSKSVYAEEARFKQAQARFKGQRFRMAAEAYKQYLNDWPNGAYIEKALLNKGVSERMAGDYTVAIDTFKSFVKKYPDNGQTPWALLEASQAAAAADLQPDAIDFLTRVIKQYRESEHYPFALYRRAYLHLSYGFYPEAREDSFTFLEKFSDSHPQLAADVNLWLADHFANKQDFVQAEHLFMEVVRRYHDLEDAPVALYEAAKCAYSVSKMENGDYGKALDYINELLSNYPEAPVRILAQAKFLRGDIASITGNFDDAAQWFKECAELVPRTDLYYAAMGRLGECYYSTATIKDDPSEDYQLALSYFNTIIEDKNSKYALVEMARYRAGKIYELLNQPDEAKDEYFEIFFKREHKRIFNWYYFARAGFDLARLYEEEGEYTLAKRIYRRLANSDIPVASDAKLKADELDKIYLKPKAE